MSSWTQIVVKGTVTDVGAALAAHCISPAAALVIPSEFDHWPGHTHCLVPSTAEFLARLGQWFNELGADRCKPGVGFPSGTLLWFGAYIGRSTKGLRRVSDYETLGTPLTSYLKEM